MPFPSADGAAAPTVTSPDRLFDTTALARLPAQATSKYAALVVERDDARALLDSAMQRRDDARDERIRAQRNLSELEAADAAGRLKRTHHDGETMTEVRDKKPLDAARARLNGALKALKEAENALAIRRERSQSLTRLVDSIEKYLSDARFDKPVTAVAPPDLSKRDTLGGIRDEIAALRKERKRIERAPCDPVEAKERAEAFVVARAQKVKVAGLFNRHSPIRFPTEAVDSVGLSPVDLACWLDPVAMVAALHREIDAGDTGDALNNAQQAQALADLEARLLHAERKEEAIVMRDNAIRRGNADVRAVLGI